jgi:class I fructose-bisphosphate aldolase
MLEELLQKLFGEEEVKSLLAHNCTKVPKDLLNLPSPSFIDDKILLSNRPVQVIKNLNYLFNSGRLKGTGYLSLLAIDQGIEHTAGASFSFNPLYFDPNNIVKLALEADCNGIVTTLGTMAAVARKYAHKIPFIIKLNHNEALVYPTKYNQIMFGSVKQAWDMGASGIGATIYFGSKESGRQIDEVGAAFEEAHSLGMFTVLWCYLRNDSFKLDGVDYHQAADITGQANYLGSTLQADIIKQKIPLTNGGFKKLNFGKTNKLMYEELCSDSLIDLCRYQILNNYMGLVPLISSGGESLGNEDLKEIIKTAIINKRAGGTGLIIGRKAFQKPINEGISLLNTVQEIYLNKNITIA